MNTVHSDTDPDRLFETCGKVDGIGLQKICISPESVFYPYYMQMIRDTKCPLNIALLEVHLEHIKITGTKVPLVMMSSISSLTINQEIVDWVVQAAIVGHTIESEDNLKHIVCQVELKQQLCEDIKLKSLNKDNVETELTHPEKKKTKKPKCDVKDEVEVKAKGEDEDWILPTKKNVPLTQKQNVAVSVFNMFAVQVFHKTIEIYTQLGMTSSSAVVLNFESCCASNCASIFHGQHHPEISSSSKLSSTQMVFLSACTPEQGIIPAHQTAVTCCETPPHWKKTRTQQLALMKDIDGVVRGDIEEKTFFDMHPIIKGCKIFTPEGLIIHFGNNVFFKFKGNDYYISSRFAIQNFAESCLSNLCRQNYFKIFKVAHAMQMLVKPQKPQ